MIPNFVESAKSRSREQKFLFIFSPYSFNFNNQTLCLVDILEGEKVVPQGSKYFLKWRKGKFAIIRILIHFPENLEELWSRN